MTDQPETERDPQEEPGSQNEAQPGMQAAGSDAGADPRLDAVRAMGAPDALASPGSDPATAGMGGIREPNMDFPSTELPPEDLPEAHPAEFPQLGAGAGTKGTHNIALLMDVQLPVSIELGRTAIPISDILEWGQGSIIELDKLAGEPVDLMVNNKLVARGEVVVVDEKFGLRITSLIARPDRLAAL